MLKSSKKTAGKKNSKKKAVLSVCLATALLITGAVAFMTATDSADNVFTVGNVKIDLTEPNWDEANAENIISGQVIAKDPTVTNTGANDAYVYVMVEVPKVYKTDIVSQNAEGEWVTEEKSQYQLFDYAVNDGWTLIDSKVTTEADSGEAYNYYLYAYDTSVAPEGSVTLFDEVKFANVTSNFINTVTGEEIVDLDINVTSYAIQSDFYGSEASNAEEAWTLFANQNEWQWPERSYQSLSTLTFISEGEVVHSETDYAGTPVTMFFTPSLARTGYSFDWVDESTNETGYTGMPMPKEDTNMIATYEEVSADKTGENGFISYRVKIADDGHYYLSPYSIDTRHEDYPNEASVLTIPSSITFTTPLPNEKMEVTTNFGIINLNNVFDDETFCTGQDVTLYVEEIEVLQELYGNESGKRDMFTSFVIPDTVTNIYTSAFVGSQALTEIELPYGITTVPSFYNCIALEKISIPNSVTSINLGVFMGCTNLKTVALPDSITSIGGSAFANCSSLEEIVLPKTLEVISSKMFYNCTNLKKITVPATIKTVEQNAFEGCTSITDVYFMGTPESTTSIEVAEGNDTLFNAQTHFPNAE